MAACDVCTRPTNGSRLCAGCLDQLKSELRTVPWLVAQLDVTLTRQARVGERNGPRSTETPLPYHLGASVDLETLRDGLAMWAEAVARQRGITVDAAREPVPLSRWLLRWAGEAAQHEAAAELHGDILAMTKAARRTIDLSPQRHFVGPCDGHRAIEPETVGCGEDLYASMNARTVTCNTDGCGAEYQIESRRAWLLEQAVDQLRTAAELSRELPWIGGVTIDRKLINKWSSRGQITRYLPHPRDTKQAPRFRVGEIIEMARSTASDTATKTAC